MNEGTLIDLSASPFSSMTQEEFARLAKSLSPETLAENIVHCHEQVARSLWEAAEPLKRGLEWAFGAGRFLLWVKKKVVKHGGFEQWVRDNCSFDERQAQRYMRLVRKWSEIQAKATSEDAFPKSIKGLLEVVAKEGRRNEVKSVAPPSKKEPVGDTSDEDQTHEPQNKQARKRTRAGTRTPAETTNTETVESSVEPEAVTDQPIAPTEAADCTAQVSGRRAFFLRPEPGYDVASVIQLLQSGEARINDDFVLLGDKEIAWLEIKEDDLAYSNFQIGLGDPTQGEITTKPPEPVVQPAATPVSLPFDPYFDPLPLTELFPEPDSEHSATER